MRSKQELKAIFLDAAQLGIGVVEVDGIKYHLPSESKKLLPIEELKSEELMKPLSVLEEYTDDEILYWSSPYFDILQERKDALTKQKQEDDLLKEAV